MANWNGLQLTNKGIALQAKVQAGTQLHITKLKLGSGVVPSGTDVKTLTDLIAPEQNLGIGGKEAVGDYCKISSTISNTGLEAGYYVRELGVFAQDPDDGEILYMYTTDGAPDYLPAGGGSTVISQEFSVMIAVDDTDNIVVDIDPAALATMGYVQLQIQEHNTDTTAHADFTGATAEAAGKRGMVPAPAAGENNKFLRGDGTWADAKMSTKELVDILYPVGHIYMSTNSANPGTLFPGTTWEAYAQGRVLIGAGTGTDSRSEKKTFTAGSTGGEYNHQLTVGEMPSHTHSASTNSSGNHSHTLNYGYDDNNAQQTSVDNCWDTQKQISTSEAGTHSHTVLIENTGNNSPHSNMQPYVVCYVFKRTA